MSCTAHPEAQFHTPDDLNVQQYRCENLKLRNDVKFDVETKK